MTAEVRARTAGSLWKILVKPGDKVKAGDVLFIMEVMKMEVPHTAPEDGEIKAVLAEEGQEGLAADTVVVVIE